MPDVKWGYGYNHFRVPGMSGTGPLLRKENHERAMKVLSVCGFKGVELQAQQGTLGTPESIELRFGPPAKFLETLRSWGVNQVSSFLMAPGGQSMGGGPAGGGQSPSDPANHARILESARPYAKFLHDVNGSCLVVRPMQSYWREAPVTEEKIKNAAACWNAVGKMTKEYNVQTALHTDFLCAIHGMGEIERLLEFTNPELVGLAADTAELAIAGVDPVALYEKHPERIKHFHFKQACTVDASSEYKEANADNRMLNGWGKKEIERWFWELGTVRGLVNFPALMKSIKQHGYTGWIIVESDRSPHPAESTMMNSWYVQHVLAKG
jgi:inosose dehydratase